jgi:hypothetical protein
VTWRLARSIVTLRAEVDLRWPHRSKVSDGTIGDAAHASRTSDHNPWVKDSAGVGVVRALDITAAGIDIDWYVEHLRKLGKNGDRRLADGGYIISKRRIASATSGWEWRHYSGANPHESHAHVSVSRTPDGYDSDRAWGIAGSTATPPTIRRGDRGPFVRWLRGMLSSFGGRWWRFSTTGLWGDRFTWRVESRVKRFQKLNGLTPDGIVGPLTWRALSERKGTAR